MLEDFIIGRIRSELSFEPNAEKTGLFQALGRFLTSREDRKAFILRGYAGTGKTSVMSALVRAMSSLNQPCVLLAPTGRAAKVLSRYSGAPAYTIHKYIYRRAKSPTPDNPTGIEGVGAYTLGYNKLLRTLFIVDEASMLSGIRDNSSFGSGCLLDDLVRYVYQGSGCSLLLVGDDAQLPPVGSRLSPALDGDYMRSTYQLCTYAYQLSQVSRQALDSGILSEATRLRELLSSVAVPHSATPTVSLQPNGIDLIRLNGNEVIEQLEQSWREVGAEETLIITRSNRLTNLYNQAVRARVLWKEDELSNGDRVMVSKNNYFWTQEYDELDFLANGDMLEIKRLYNHHALYGFRFARAVLRSVDNDWEIDALLWLDTLGTDNPEDNYVLQKELFSRISEDYPEIRSRKKLVDKIYESPYYNALQVRLSYAVTCHKAQGGQWKHVYLDTSGIGEDESRMADACERTEYLRWLYTAVTRATEKVYILR